MKNLKTFFIDWSLPQKDVRDPSVITPMEQLGQDDSGTENYKKISESRMPMMKIRVILQSV